MGSSLGPDEFRVALRGIVARLTPA
jgi:hypothetical protein